MEIPEWRDRSASSWAFPAVGRGTPRESGAPGWLWSEPCLAFLSSGRTTHVQNVPEAESPAVGTSSSGPPQLTVIDGLMCLPGLYQVPLE